MVHLKLDGHLSFVDSLDPTKKNEPKKIDLEDLAMPACVLEQEASITDAQLLGFAPEDARSVSIDNAAAKNFPSLGLGPRIDDDRISTARDVIALGLEVNGIVHSRLAFSASSLVTLVLAAGLAIIFRGGQLLTAFIISFVPGLLVVVINVMGRQLAEKPGLGLLGLMIIWSGIVLLAMADAVVLTRYLRR